MQQLQTHEDISLLVRSFYSKVRKDNLLGPIFNRIIKEDEWSEHFDKLTRFWASNLFAEQSYFGSPTQAHVDVDRRVNHRIEQEHFGRWLQLWFETIDELFEGKKSTEAKEMARKMAHAQFLAIWKNKER